MDKKIINAIVAISFLAIAGTAFFTAKAEDSSASTKNNAKTVDLACAQTAVEKRENAVASAWSSLNSSITATLATRKDALKIAWAITDANQRRTAIKTAWTNSKSADKTARTAFRKAQKAAWTQFKTDAKSCRATATYEEQGNDIQL